AAGTASTQAADLRRGAPSPPRGIHAGGHRPPDGQGSAHRAEIHPCGCVSRAEATSATRGPRRLPGVSGATLELLISDHVRTVWLRVRQRAGGAGPFLRFLCLNATLREYHTAPPKAASVGPTSGSPAAGASPL